MSIFSPTILLRLTVKTLWVLNAVSFMADLGGLYCFSICIFFFLLLQCEYRIKKLRHEATVMRNIRNRQKAQQRWDKLRKYVMYTWGCSSLDDNKTNERNEACCAGLAVDSFRKSRSSRRLRQRKTSEMLSFNKNAKLPSEKHTVPEINEAQVSKCLSKPSSNPEERSLYPIDEPEHRGLKNVKNGKTDSTVGSILGEVSQTEALHILDDLSPPPPPVLESGPSGEINITDIQKSLQNLYDYNVILRDKLVATQSILHALRQKKSSPSPEAGH